MAVEIHVLRRYTQGAQCCDANLCCPVSYDPKHLQLIPNEIVEKDYGCGDPSRYVREGDVVLDLGCGAGKLCYIAAQLVGPRGMVLGVDMNDTMLSLARTYQKEMAEKLGGNRVRFVKGLIQDLRLDVEAAEAWLAEHPVTAFENLLAFEAWKAEQKASRPLIADESVDLVISNCVLNLVDDADKRQLFAEIFRVVKPGGRIAISDIVVDKPLPVELKKDPELWSGCLSGAMEEHAFVQAFAEAGFVAIQLDVWAEQPWKVLGDLSFRSVTVTAVKPSKAPCVPGGFQLIYRGPFASVSDDEGHTFPRGQRVSVCDRSFHLLTREPYARHFVALNPSSSQDPPGNPEGSEHAGCCGSSCC